MSADIKGVHSAKLRNWLKNRPAGAERVQLVQDTVIGAQSVAEWLSDQIAKGMEPEAPEDPIDILATMIEEAQGITDANACPCKFKLRWMCGERVLSNFSFQLKVSPDVDSAREASPQHADPIVRELLGHISLSQRQQNASLATLTTAYERMINTLGAHLENAHKRLAAAQEREDTIKATVVHNPEQSPEQREESLQRAKLLEAATAKVPDLIDAGLAALVHHYLPGDGKPGVQ